MSWQFCNGLTLFIYAFSVSASGYIFLHYAESTRAISPLLPRYAPAHSSWGVYVMNLAIPLSVLLALLPALLVVFIKRSKLLSPNELDQSLDS